MLYCVISLHDVLYNLITGCIVSIHYRLHWVITGCILSVDGRMSSIHLSLQRQLARYAGGASLKLKSSYRLHTQLVAPNHWLVTQRERHAAAVRQLSNGTNGDDLYIRITTVGNTIQTVNSPMYNTYTSTPGNTAKLWTTHSSIQTAQSSTSLVGSEPTMH